jgi:hypothetical protein
MGKLGLRQSCGRTGSCFDNAAAESFWALLKEEIGTRTWPDRATARTEIFTFIETFYNRRRLRKHKIFGYLTPAELEIKPSVIVWGANRSPTRESAGHDDDLPFTLCDVKSTTGQEVAGVEYRP